MNLIIGIWKGKNFKNLIKQIQKYYPHEHRTHYIKFRNFNDLQSNN